MSDLAQDDFANLPGGVRRLSAALSRPRSLALICIVTLTALGWLALGLMSSGSRQSWQMLCGPVAAGGAGGVPLLAPMWAAMIFAMMLPTAGPMILTYAEIADTAARKSEPVVSPFVLAGGYVAVWLGFALAAALLQGTLMRAGIIDGDRASWLLSGAIFVGAGAYQFSSLKQSCLTLCQSPFPFFFANWTERRAGVFKLGLRQGLACLGCCWAMMLLMFSVGTMNVVWMAALGVVMTAEKLAITPRIREVIGVGLIGAGLIMVVSSVV